jgi:pseudouridine kinase
LDLPLLIGLGGAHIDRRGLVIGDYVPAASNPGTMREEAGGGMLNALRNARQRGVSCRIVSVRGGDQAGEMVARVLDEAGIDDLSATFLDRATPSYTALLDAGGELIAGLADMDLYERAFPRIVMRRHVREALGAADAVLIDANMPARAIETVVDLAGTAPVHAIAISPAKVERLGGVLDRLACLFLNRREAERLSGHADPRDAASALMARGLAAGVISAGASSVIGFEAGEVFALAPPAIAEVSDVTGAGDALGGATVAALMRGYSLREAVREGIAAASLTIASPTTVARLEAPDFAAALALVPGAVTVA